LDASPVTVIYSGGKGTGSPSCPVVRFDINSIIWYFSDRAS